MLRKNIVITVLAALLGGLVCLVIGSYAEVAIGGEWPEVEIPEFDYTLAAILQPNSLSLPPMSASSPISGVTFESAEFGELLAQQIGVQEIKYGIPELVSHLPNYRAPRFPKPWAGREGFDFHENYFVLTFPSKEARDLAFAELSAAESLFVAAPDSDDSVWVDVPVHPEVVQVWKREPQRTLAFNPNDSLWSKQWAARNVSYRGIEAQNAWDITRGDTAVLVGVVGSGVFMGHEDLQDRTFHPESDVTVGFQHETGVTSIIAATTNNTRGMAGVDWFCQIIAIDASSTPPYINPDKAAAGIYRCVNAGARVINLSFGGYTSQPVERDACAYALNNGVIIVAAAGNDDTYNVCFPAGFDGQGHICVGAIDYDGNRSGFSNMGSHLDLVAGGGEDTNSTNDQNIATAYYKPGSYQSVYRYKRGTSFSAPHVTAIIALMFAVEPNLSPHDVEKILTMTAMEKGDPGHDDEYGWGLAKAPAALNKFDDYNRLATATVNGMTIESEGDWEFRYFGGSQTGVIPNTYRAKPIKVSANVSYPREMFSWEYVIGDGTGSNCWGPWVSNWGIHFCEVDASSITSTGATVSTWVYHLKSIGGTDFGIWPCSPEEAVTRISILGEPLMLGPSAYVNSDPATGVIFSWNENNDIEDNHRVYRTEDGVPTNYWQPAGPGSKTFPGDTLASTFYTYWVEAINAHQVAVSATRTVKHPPRTPDNISAVVLSGGTSNKVQVTWQHSANQPAGTLDKYLVQHGFQNCSWYPDPGGGYYEVCDTSWLNDEVSTSETSFTRCLSTNSAYAIRVLAVDVYNDTNTVRPTHYITTGSDDDCAPPPCPTLYVQTEGGYEIDNNILSASEDTEQAPGFLRDYYLLQREPDIDEHGFIHLQLREDEQQTTTFDGLKLTVAWVDEGREIGISDQGTVFYPIQIKMPVSVSDGSGDDRLSQLDTKDGNSFTSHAPGELIINFGKVRKSGLSASAQASDDGPGLPPPDKDMEKISPYGDPASGNILRVDVMDESGNWVKTGIVPPRKFASFNYIDLSNWVRDDEDLWVRLRWDYAYSIDHLAYYEFNATGIKLEEFTPATVSHSSLGDTREALITNGDDATTTLSPGEVISLSFGPIPKAPEGKSAKYVLTCTGRYTTDGSDLSTGLTAPEGASLNQNTPNPFNASTVIEFSLPHDGNVRLEVYDVLGRRVRLLIDDYKPAGYHSIAWNGRDDGGVPVASGIYFCRLTTEDFAETRKMVLMK